MSDGLPIVDYRDIDCNPDRGAVLAGILLAAGTSSRFGDENKLLVPIDDVPVVRHAARCLSEAGLAPLVGVVGDEATRVKAAIDGLGFETVSNPEYEDGQSGSVAAGVEGVRSRADAAVFGLGDMPAVRPRTVRALIAAYEAGEGTALAAAYEGERGNPVVFDARYFDALADRSGDVGGRDILIRSDDAVLVETGDPGVRMDVDTPEDLVAVRRYLMT